MIEHLDELGLSGDDLAAHRIAKKNKAKIDQHPPKAESSVATLTAAASATEPVDLKRPDPVAEHVGELDASAEAAVENLMAREEAYEDQPDEPTARTVAMREYLAKQPMRGGARPAACEDFGIDVADPQALDKVRTAFKLKKFGKSLADLEAYHPGFWALPLETDDRSPSRKLVLSRFLWNRETEIERQKKREAKIAAKGWPANYHDLPPHQQRTIRNRLLKRKSRERAKALGAPLA